MLLTYTILRLAAFQERRPARRSTVRSGFREYDGSVSIETIGGRVAA
jgi:hypothetical protein